MTKGKNAFMENYRQKTTFSHVVSHVTFIKKIFSVISASFWVGTGSFLLRQLNYG